MIPNDPIASPKNVFNIHLYNYSLETKALDVFLSGFHVFSLDLLIVHLLNVWDALDLRVRQLVPVHTNIQQLCTAIEEDWNKIPQATISSLINSMRRSCVALYEANHLSVHREP